MAFCLPKEKTNKLLTALREGKIMPEKLYEMSSPERRSFFENIVGKENAQEVNALIESKLILKDYKRGLVTAINQLISDPKVKGDLVAKVEKMSSLLTPESERAFKADLVAKKMGTELTMEQANNIADGANIVSDAKANAGAIVGKEGFDLKKETPAEAQIRMEYGLKNELFKEYVNSLKTEGKGRETSLWEDIVNATNQAKTMSVGQLIKRIPIEIGNIAKTLVASWDNSFFLNQGLPALFDYKTAPDWFNAFKKSFGDIALALKGGDPIMGVKAEIFSRPNALDASYQTSKLDIGIKTEEAIPTRVLEKLPILGRFFKASNAAYDAAALRLRADIFDWKKKEFADNGINMKDKTELESLGQVVNAFTGRGDTGKLTGEGVNALVFSMKLAKSKWDIMTFHIFSDNVTPYGKQQAAYSLLRMIGTSITLMALSEVINPGSTEPDPRGTNWGKIKISDTWYPTALSFAGLPNLIARTLIPTTHNGQWGLWYKNSQGQYKSLIEWRNGKPILPKYGAITAKDIAEGYAEGKASPLMRALIDNWNGQDFNKNLSTPGRTAINLVKPISFQQIGQTLNDPKEEWKPFAIFMEVLGSNTTSASKQK